MHHLTVTEYVRIKYNLRCPLDVRNIWKFYFLKLPFLSLYVFKFIQYQYAPAHVAIPKRAIVSWHFPLSNKEYTLPVSYCICIFVLRIVSIRMILHIQLQYSCVCNFYLYCFTQTWKHYGIRANVGSSTALLLTELT